jgi:hypothetical protein
MHAVQVSNHTTPLKTPLHAGYCSSFLCKLRGLTWRRALAADSGLLLVGARDSRVDASIHMLFVFFDLGIVWINDAGIVVDVQLAKQWVSLLAPQEPARYTLEVHPSRMIEFTVGDRIEFLEIA